MCWKIQRERIMDRLLQRIANLIDNKDHRIIIGISGHGASGKTTFANKLVKFLGQKNSDFINTDPFMHPYHRNFDVVLKNSNEEYYLEKDNINVFKR